MSPPRPHPLARVDTHLWTFALLLGVQLALVAKIGAAVADARRLERQRQAHVDELLEHAQRVAAANGATAPARTIIAPPQGPAEVREP